MAIIVVGDFDKLQVIEQLLQTFGSIPPKAVPERTEPQASATSSYKTVTGTFSPLLSSDTSIGVMYRLPGYWSEDNFALMIIEQYLDFKINETIRIDRGLSYAPGTWAYNFSDYGLFGVNADVDSDDIDEALSLIKKEMSQLAEQPMNEALMQEAKLKILLRNVQGYEANMDFADYYANQYLLFRKHRYYEDVEEKIEAVTVDDIRRVVDEYLRDDKAVTLIESPTLTYTQFYVVLSLLVVFVGLIIVIFYVRTHARFRAKKIS